MQMYSIMVLCLVSSLGYAMEPEKGKEMPVKKSNEMELLPLPHGSLEYIKRVYGQTEAIKYKFNSDIDQISEKRQRFPRELP